MTNEREVLDANEAFYRLRKKDIEAMSVVWSQERSLCIHPGRKVRLEGNSLLLGDDI